MVFSKETLAVVSLDDWLVQCQIMTQPARLTFILGQVIAKTCGEACREIQNLTKREHPSNYVIGTQLELKRNHCHTNHSPV